MATIKINDLNATGSFLFNDSESYLGELTEEEKSLAGGIYTSYRWNWNPPIRIPRFWA